MYLNVLEFLERNYYLHACKNGHFQGESETLQCDESHHYHHLLNGAIQSVQYLCVILPFITGVSYFREFIGSLRRRR